MKVSLSVPKSNTPMILPDGSVSREWYNFFTNLAQRVGGNDSQSDLIDDADGTLADATRAINEILDALESFNILTE